MTKMSDNASPSLLFTEGTVPASPAAGKQRVYIDSTTHRWKRVTSSGATVTVDGGAQLDYVTVTSNTNATATTEATANTVVTSSAITYDGATVILIEAYSPNLNTNNVANQDIRVWLYDGSSSIGLLGLLSTTAANIAQTPFYAARQLTPSNASHTYSIRISSTAGAGIFSGGAGGAGNYMPGFIRITLV